MESAKIFNYYEFLTKSELNTRKLIKVWTHLFDYFFYFEEDEIEAKELSTERSGKNSMSEVSEKEEESEELIKLNTEDIINDVRFNSSHSLKLGNNINSNTSSNQQKINKRREVFKNGKLGYEGVMSKKPSVEIRLSRY